MAPRTIAARLIARAAKQQRSLATTSAARSAASFEPALPRGVSPAYDAALDFIASHQSRTLAELQKLRSQIPSSSAPSLELLSRLDTLEVEAYANDPAVRTRFKNTGGKGEMDKKIMRWFAEKRWKQEGGLDLLMQRALQMNVVPDVLPDIPTTAPLTISLESPIVPGAFQPPSFFSSPPRVTHQLFHHPSLPTTTEPNPTALHTLLVVDPDAPDHENHSFQQRVLYLKQDIPISVVDGEVDLMSKEIGKEVLGWEPPSPERGTPYHRYVFLVIRQSPEAGSLPTPAREAFDVRAFLSAQSLTSHAVTGVSLFRAEWSAEEDEFINSVFRDLRGEPAGAPVYGKVPKAVRYGRPLRAKQVRKEQIREEIRERVWDDLAADMSAMGIKVEFDKNGRSKL
ncbi:hypothetical protein IAT38_005795 [Cryptococcus sp. DSM 104549]